MKRIRLSIKRDTGDVMTTGFSCCLLASWAKCAILAVQESKILEVSWQKFNVEGAGYVCITIAYQYPRAR